MTPHTPTTVFVDSSAFIALIDADDNRHSDALETWRTGLLGGDAYVSTNYVILETTAVLQRRFGLEVVRRFVTDMLPVVRIEWVGGTDHDAGLALLLAEARRGLSLVDCASFVVMRRLGLGTAFALDRHFAEQGFAVKPAAAR